MKVIRLNSCARFIAGDRSILREILNPRKSGLKVNYSLAYARVRKKQKTLPHRLKHTEVYHILAGKGRMHINGQQRSVKQCDTVYIPAGAVQYIENTGSVSLKFLCIVNPPWQPACEMILAINDATRKRSRH
jgi:mannose-6-phosphate isomerase-like protein (cupin superfamily)